MFDTPFNIKYNSNVKRKIEKMRFFSIVLFIFTICIAGCAQTSERLIIASTTSIEASGLYEVLNPPFEKRFACQIYVIAVGTGKALEIASNGDADLVFVHNREAEEKFIKEGYGVNRREVMCNDFVIIGPPDDPAGIKGMKDAKKALKKIADRKCSFVSRGDASGTYMREINLWKKAKVVPKGKWYLEVGQNMAATINIADQKRAYTLSDRATYLTLSSKVNLEILCEGDPELFNPYSVIAVNPAKFPNVNYLMAMSYIGWVTSQKGQKIIAEFGKDKFGQSLFVPLAIPKKLIR